MIRLAFTVLGKPQPAGSKRAFAIKRGGVPTGQIAVSDANPRAKSWQQEVRVAAHQAIVDARGAVLLDGPLGLRARFHRARPKSHYRTGRNAHLLRDAMPSYPAVKPDVDKLSRAVLDALSGVVYRDDAQIVHKSVDKRYGTPERVEITVWTLSDDADAPTSWIAA